MRRAAGDALTLEEKMATIFKIFIAYFTSRIKINTTARNIHIERVAIVCQSPQKDNAPS
jgi:hypothetical protein